MSEIEFWGLSNISAHISVAIFRVKFGGDTCCLSMYKASETPIHYTFNLKMAASKFIETLNNCQQLLIPKPAVARREFILFVIFKFMLFY